MAGDRTIDNTYNRYNPDDLFTVEDVQTWLSNPLTKLFADVLKKRIQEVKDRYGTINREDFDNLKGVQEGYERSLLVLANLAKDIAEDG